MRGRDVDIRINPGGDVSEWAKGVGWPESPHWTFRRATGRGWCSSSCGEVAVAACSERFASDVSKRQDVRGRINEHVRVSRSSLFSAGTTASGAFVPAKSRRLERSEEPEVQVVL